MKLFERDEPEVKPAPEVKAAAQDTVKQDAPMTTKPKETPAPAAVGSTGREGLSVIGKTLFVKGEVEAAEDMLVEGRVEGLIKHTANQLTIGVSGVVNADIDAKNLVIEGTVEGNIVGAESVVICDSADVRGCITVLSSADTIFSKPPSGPTLVIQPQNITTAEYTCVVRCR